MDKSLIAKFKIKPHASVLVLNSPQGYLLKSFQADTRAVKNKRYDFIQLFVYETSDLKRLAPIAVGALSETGTLWICYPKKSSGVKTDINRDTGWNALTATGFRPVSQISIDETWSALRFKPGIVPVKKTIEKKSADRKKFTALIEKPDDNMDTAYVSVPFSVEKVFGKKGNVKVKAWFEGHPYRGILANMGTGSHIIILRKDIRQALGKKAGDKVMVELQVDTDERIVDVPDTLKKALIKKPEAEKIFNALSYTNRKEFSNWVSAAKKSETIEKRILQTIEKLLEGKKNPFHK